MTDAELRFGRWTVIGAETRRGGQPFFPCRCDCGTERLVARSSLRIGHSTSCGCGRVHARHGEARVGAATAEYKAWQNMKNRTSPFARPKERANYYDRGIRVCPEWEDDFESFLSHVGRRPSPKHSLDRVNNDLGYQPGNVRWATAAEQVRNRRCVKLTASDVETIRSDAAAGVSINSLARRFRISWQAARDIVDFKIWRLA